MTISFSNKEIDSLMLVVSIETGQKAEVFSIMMPKLSLCGSMKKIS